MTFVLDIELQGNPKLKGHDHFWKVISKLGADGTRFTMLDVVGDTNAHKATVNDYVKRLTRGGFLREAGFEGEGRYRQKAYVLVAMSATTPSLRRDGSPGVYGRGRQNIWNVLRSPVARGGVGADDLVMLAATDEVKLELVSAQEYLKMLERGGYLRVTRKAAHFRYGRYTLIRDTGPLAPKLLKTKVLYDQNQRTIFGQFLTAEEAA